MSAGGVRGGAIRWARGGATDGKKGKKQIEVKQARSRAEVEFVVYL